MLAFANLKSSVPLYWEGRRRFVRRDERHKISPAPKESANAGEAPMSEQQTEAAATTPPPDAGGEARVDASEVAKFDRIAADWWRLDGPFAPLHKMQPVRLDFIKDQIAAEFGLLRSKTAPRPYAPLRLVDIGCGGGLLCEPMARLGAAVTGLDASEHAIAVARAHAAEGGLKIDYRQATSHTLAAEIAAGAAAPYDAALSFEVVEHVADPDAFLRDMAALLKPGGLAMVSTMNRTALSLALGVVAAEYVLGWLPRGSHDWRRFLAPDSLAEAMSRAGLEPVDRAGFVYDPLADGFRRSKTDLQINYAIAAVKR